MNRVRLIKEKSRHYNTSDRISGLLHKISNEIIKRCKDTISVKDILDDNGDVVKCMIDLEDAIKCGKSWKDIYLKMTSKKTKTWDYNKNSIFA